MKYIGLLVAAVVVLLFAVGTARADHPPGRTPVECEVLPDVECEEPEGGDAPTHAPVISTPMYTSLDEVSLPLFDDWNPKGTEYQVVFSDWYGEEEDVVLDWSESKCRSVSGLKRPKVYRVYATARTPDGVESETTEGVLHQWGGDVLTDHTPSDDPWLAERREEMADIYHLTDEAREWLSTVPVKVHRNEPGFAGYWGVGRGIRVGMATDPWTLSHEYMHAFWNEWTGFPEPCDEMNLLTFRRDLAEFMMNFALADRMDRTNPNERYRPYYNAVIAFFDDYRQHRGGDGWSLVRFVHLEGEYGGQPVWDYLYHVAETEIPMMVFGKMDLVPPQIARYYEGFIEPVEGEASWKEELDRFAALTLADRWVMDHTIGRYYFTLLEGYDAPEASEPTMLPEPLRSRAWGADRQAVVDFINTLEDMACNADCEPLWEADPRFWRWHCFENLRRFVLHRVELDAETSFELSDENRRTMLGALDEILACEGAKTHEDVAEFIAELNGVSEVQREALLAVLAAREWLVENYVRFCGWNEREEIPLDYEPQPLKGEELRMWWE